MWSTRIFKCVACDTQTYWNVLRLMYKDFQVCCMWHANIFKCVVRDTQKFSSKNFTKNVSKKPTKITIDPQDTLKIHIKHLPNIHQNPHDILKKSTKKAYGVLCVFCLRAWYVLYVVCCMCVARVLCVCVAYVVCLLCVCVCRVLYVLRVLYALWTFCVLYVLCFMSCTWYVSVLCDICRTCLTHTHLSPSSDYHVASSPFPLSHLLIHRHHDCTLFPVLNPLFTIIRLLSKVHTQRIPHTQLTPHKHWPTLSLTQNRYKRRHKLT